jgi:hypothetical protein
VGKPRIAGCKDNSESPVKKERKNQRQPKHFIKKLFTFIIAGQEPCPRH